MPPPPPSGILHASDQHVFTDTQILWIQVPLLNCRLLWAANASQIGQNKPAGMFGKCPRKLQNQVYKAILFTSNHHELEGNKDELQIKKN